MIDNYAAYKYETPYKGPFLITQCWTNGMATVQYGEAKIRYTIQCIKPYTYDKTLKILTPKLNIDNITLGKYQLHTYVFILKIGTKYINQIPTGTLT